jgi:diaminobutyrate-2-oxoglutarate transaminase
VTRSDQDALLARQRDRESNARTYSRSFPMAVDRALGCELWSVEGRRYLDFFSGSGVMAVGHNHPEVIEAVEAQLRTHVHGLDLATRTRDRFVTELFELLPAPMRDRMKIHICAPTGSDAVEAALKLCKQATGRSPIVAFQGSYHGMTSGALAVSSRTSLKLPGLVPDVAFAPYAHCYRCPLGLAEPSCKTACAAYVETLLADDLSGVPLPAAAIVELVQGEGGSVIPTRAFVQRIREATRRAGVPLIADEIQAGLGRTGRWWAFEHFDIEPDVIITSKALGGIGLPIAAILYRRELDVWEPGAHIGTFRGHQLAMAAGTTAFAIMKRDRVLDNVRHRGEQLLAGLRGLEHPAIGDVRGVGLMAGVDLVQPGTRRPAPELARAVRSACFERGLLCELGGRQGATLRCLPPLVITEAHVSEALAILGEALRAVPMSLLPEAR